MLGVGQAKLGNRCSKDKIFIFVYISAYFSVLPGACDLS